MKLELLRKSDRTARLLILGSSRTWQFSPQTIHRLTGRTAVNMSVGSCRAEDYLLITHYSIHHGRTPGIIILGIDLEAFHNGLPVDSQWKRLGPDSRALIAQLRQPSYKTFFQNASELLSYHMTTASAGSLARYVRATNPAPRAIFAEDGTIRYPRWEAQIADHTFDLQTNIAASIQEYRRRLQDFTALADWRKAYFREFLLLCREHGIKVAAFVTTLHPQLTADLTVSTEYAERKAELWAYLQSLRVEFAFELHDFEDPESYGGNDVDFWDGAHISANNGDRLLNYLVVHSPTVFTKLNQASHAIQ